MTELSREALQGRLDEPGGPAELTVTQVLDYAGGGDTNRGERVRAEAIELVADQLLVTVELVTVVPPATLRRAVLQAAASLYAAQDAPHGVLGFADQAGAPVRVSRDPLAGVRPLLASYTGGGFA